MDFLSDHESILLTFFFTTTTGSKLEKNPEVLTAVLRVMQFWYDLGVDGFRLNVFNCKHPTLLSNPRRWDFFRDSGIHRLSFFQSNTHS